MPSAMQGFGGYRCIYIFFSQLCHTESCRCAMYLQPTCVELGLSAFQLKAGMSRFSPQKPCLAGVQDACDPSGNPQQALL